LKRLLLFVLLPIFVIGALYVVVVMNWNYSAGERAGWVQKLSRKGWVCKTWEGEMAMVSMPGATPEKFLFTVWDDRVAANINEMMGKRVTLHYEEKVGLPSTCFGETRHYITRVTLVDEVPLGPGLSYPQPAPRPAEPAAGAAPAAPPTASTTATPPAGPSPAAAPAASAPAAK
jgi:hypothetical protein